MNPASRSGMIVDIPRPAGVIAPVRLMPTVTSSSSISSVNRRHPSARRPELYARNALSTSSGTVSRPVMGFGSMRWPRRKSLRVVMASGVSVDGRELSAAALPGLPDDDDRVTRGIGRVEQIQVGCRDLSFPGDPIAQPVRHPHPVRPAEQYHGKVTDLAGLDQGQRFEQLVHGAEATGEDDERRRVLHEHGLAHEEITEIDGPLHVGVEPLLERQLDVAADVEAVTLLAAAIGI